MKKKNKEMRLYVEGQIRMMTKSEFQITKENTENRAAETKSRLTVAWQIRKNSEKAFRKCRKYKKKNEERRETLV